MLVLAFNRPDLLQRVLDALAGGQRPVFVSIDGPRHDRPGERELCERVRAVAESIDWSSELHINARETNLGCGPAVSSGISWALEQVDEVIVIEDDCLPHPSFLRFCDELLGRYRKDERVMQIAATNWGADSGRYAGYSYGFTAFGPVCGWATWRRAWNLYEYELASWPRIKSSGLDRGMEISDRFRRLLERDWERAHAGRGTWDHQWQYTILRHHGLSVSPAHNLAVNIGLRPDGTQQREPDHVFSVLDLDGLEFPLRHPPEVARNATVDSVFERIYWQKHGWPGRLYRATLRTQRLRRLARPFIPRPG